MRASFIIRFVVAASLLACSAHATAQDSGGDPKPGSRLKRDPFQASVQEAITRGTAALYRMCIPVLPPGQSYPLGIRAISVYALLESGTSPGSPIVGRLFKEMEAIPLRKVYSVSIYAMALDAWMRKAPPEEGREKRDPRRKQLERCVEWLIKARLVRRGIWGYERLGRATSRLNTWVDFSNTQFAVLALQVALKNDIEVPEEVWEEIIESHLEAAQPTATLPGRILCEGGGWWTDSGEAPKPTDPGNTSTLPPGVIFTSGGFALQGIPVGWPYKPAYNRQGRRQGRVTFSMTSAALSCLMVSREALARAGELEAESRDAVDRTVAQGLVQLRREWESLFVSNMDTLLRNYYYTLYSFEKAMDLGGVVKLGGIDWYQEQARVLIAEQRKDGAWGAPSPGLDSAYDRVSTAFSLLFMCRATRNLRIEPPDPILTANPDEDKTSSVARGRVYLPSRGGMVQLSELFGMMADLRTSELLAAGEELVDSLPPTEVPELMPYLAELRGGARDAVDRFARANITTISGLPGDATIATIEKWLEQWRELRAWGDARDESVVEEIHDVLLSRRSTLPLQLTALEVCLRIGSLESVPTLLSLLESDVPEIRQGAHDALSLLTQRRTPFDPLASPEERSDGIAAWRVFWSEEGSRLLFRQRWGRLRVALEKAEKAEDRARIREEIIALGEPAVKEIDTILAGDRYLFDWVLIRRALTGKRQGL